MLPADERHRDGSKGCVAIVEVDRTMTNGMRLEGHMMVPNLDYKKDTFLELSLISNFLFNITLPIPPLLCLPLVVPTSKFVVNPTWVLLLHLRPMDPLPGPTVSLRENLNYSKSIGRLEERCCPGLTFNR